MIGSNLRDGVTPWYSAVVPAPDANTSMYNMFMMAHYDKNLDSAWYDFTTDQALNIIQQYPLTRFEGDAAMNTI